MINFNKIVVIGAGSWGTALSILLSSNGYNVTLWGYNSDHIKVLRKEKENSKYLPDIFFPENLIIEGSLVKAIENAELLIFAIPSHAFREIFKSFTPVST